MGQVPVIRVNEHVDLRIVRTYRHLGVHASLGRSLLKEITARCQEASGATSAERTPVLTQGAFPKGTRTRLVAACAASRLFQAAGSWPALPPSLFAKVSTAYMRPLRHIAGGRRLDTTWKSDVQICEELGVPPVRAHVYAAVARHAQRMSEAPADIRALARGPGGVSWRRHLTQALAALQRVLWDKLADMPPPEAAPDEWECLWREHPREWGAMVRLFLRRAAAHPRMVHEKLEVDQASAEDEDGEWLCTMCEKLFATAAGLQGHRARVHGLARPGTRVAADTVCPHCGMDHRSHARLVKHLNYGAKKCVAAAAACSQEPPSDLMERVRARATAEAKAAKKEGRHVLSGPPVRRQAATIACME